MSKTLNPVLSIDLKIRLRGNVFNWSLGPSLKWLIPLAVAAIKLIVAHFQHRP